MKILKIFLLISFLVTSLSACGFRLRGYEPLPPALHVIYVKSTSPYGQFTKDFKQALKKMGVIVVNNTQCAPVMFDILSENLTSTMTSQGASGQLTTYLLTYSVTYQLLNAGERTLIPPQTVTASRTYYIAANQILGDLSVQSDLKDDMERDVMNQILMRLRSRTTQLLLQNACTNTSS